MWIPFVALLVVAGAVTVYTAPARMRRHDLERGAVLRALAALRPSGTEEDVAREVAERAGLRLSIRIVRAHLVGLEEDGFAAVLRGGTAERPTTRYRLLVEAPPASATRGAAPAPSLTVYHDGACPLCAAEIALYRRAAGAEAVGFVDASGEGAPAADLPREAALARFHVRDARGELLSGAAAFAALWRVLPGWRWLGRLVASPVLLPLAEAAYRGLLPLRPRLARALVGLGVLAPAGRRRFGRP